MSDGNKMKAAIRSMIWELPVILFFLFLGFRAQYPVVMAAGIGALVIWPMRVLRKYGEPEDNGDE